VVTGSLDLDRLHELIGFRPHDETESTTIGGLVTNGWGVFRTWGEGRAGRHSD